MTIVVAVLSLCPPPPLRQVDETIRRLHGARRAKYLSPTRRFWMVWKTPSRGSCRGPGRDPGCTAGPKSFKNLLKTIDLGPRGPGSCPGSCPDLAQHGGVTARSSNPGNHASFWVPCPPATPAVRCGWPAVGGYLPRGWPVPGGVTARSTNPGNRAHAFRITVVEH